jgi:hypothetical protein
LERVLLSSPERGVRSVTTIERSIVIKAPPKQVFTYLDEPVHLLEIWPSMFESRTFRRYPRAGIASTGSTRWPGCGSRASPRRREADTVLPNLKDRVET